MNVPCPQCKKQTEYSAENPFRPFCSERCRLIDLGNWADGSYAIAVKPSAEDLLKLADEGDADRETRSGAEPGSSAGEDDGDGEMRH